MLDTPLVTTARSIKTFLQQLKADSLISFGQSFYHSVLLKDNGSNFIRKKLNGAVYKLVPDLAVSADIYEPHVIAWLKQYLQAGDTFWDIGANWGIVSLAAAQIVGTNGQVIAVEPSKVNADWLNRHIVMNQCADIVTVMEVAICEKDCGTVTFSLLNEGCSSMNSLMFSSSVNEKAPQVSQEISVPAKNLDTLLLEQEKLPNLVKIDVEGAELRVLQGATKLLNSEKPPIVILAVHPFWLATSQDCQTIVDILQLAGYRICNRDGSTVEALEYDEYMCLPSHL